MIEEVVDDSTNRPDCATLRVGEVMGPAVAVREDTTLREVAGVMLEQHVQAVLVVNPRAEVVGVVTEKQLTLDGRYLRMACAEVGEIGGRWVTSREEIDAACIAARTMTVRDVMEKRLTSARVEEPVGAAVERMLRRDAEYAVVEEESSVVGVLGSHDLLRKVAGEPTTRRVTARLCMNDLPVHIASGRLPRSLMSWLVGSGR